LGKVLGRQDILGASDVRTVTVPVPEWGGDVLVRALNGRERDQFDESMVTETAGKRGRKERRVRMQNARARLVAMCVVDEDGKRVFSTDDVAALGEKSAAALQRVFDVASSLAGLSNDDLEELLGNSGAGQAGASPTA
jgi:hypothetical protein